MPEAKAIANPTAAPAKQANSDKPELAKIEKPEPAAIPVTMDYQQGFTSGR